MVCRSASSSVFVYRSLRWPMAYVLRGRASPRSGESRCDVSRSLYYNYVLSYHVRRCYVARFVRQRPTGFHIYTWYRHREVGDSHECFVDTRPSAALFADLPSVTEWGGGSELEIEARFGNKRRGNTATRCAQCRFKMAPVRDRYRGIFVKMSVFVMYLVVGRPE